MCSKVLLDMGNFNDSYHLMHETESAASAIENLRQLRSKQRLSKSQCVDIRGNNGVNESPKRETLGGLLKWSMVLVRNVVIAQM